MTMSLSAPFQPCPASSAYLQIALDLSRTDYSTERSSARSSTANGSCPPNGSRSGTSLRLLAQ
jgi:hypothetical protein